MAKSLTKIANELATIAVKQTKAMQDEDKRLTAFSDIKAETDKVGAINGETADWEVIEKASLNYLRKAEKDIRIGAYLARAWAMNKGQEGMTAGSILIDSLLEHAGETIAPPRVNGRRQAIDWWAKQSLTDWQQRLGRSAKEADRRALCDALASLKHRTESDSKLAGKPAGLDALIAGVLQTAKSADEEASSGALSDNDSLVTQDLESEVEEIATDAPDAIDSDVDKLQGQDPDSEEPGEEEAAGSDTKTTNGANQKAESLAAEDPGIEALINRLLSPVSEGNPVGEDHYLSDEFDAIQTDINAGWHAQATEWDAFLEQCTQFLAKFSKDIRIMVYTIYALTEVDNVTGLWRGLHVLDAFLDRFGGSCYPQRTTGRRAALSWLAKSIHEWFRRRPETIFDLDQLKLIRTMFDQLNERLLNDEELGVQQAALGKAITAIRGQIERAEANLTPTPRAAPASRPSQQKAQSVSSAAPQQKPAEESLSVEVAEDDDAFRKAMNSGNRYILNLVRYQQANHPDHPMAYRLLRQWAWCSLGGQIKVDKIPAPGGPNWPNWEMLVAAGNPEKLLEVAEGALFKHRFCLDLNRYSCTALEQLGYLPASQAIKDELLQLLQKFPNLATDVFSDGQGTADSETQDWIKQLRQNSSGESLDFSTARLDGSSNDLDERGLEALSKARKLVKEGDKSSAVAELEQHLRSSDSQKEKFYWRQILARLFLESNAIELALVMLETLEQAIVDYRLEEWDCNLTIELALLVQQVDQKIGKTSPLKQRMQSIVDNTRARVTRLDPSLAIERFGR